jgi:hypothetical protein
VDNIQDGTDNCGHYYLSDTELQELLNLCKRVQHKHSLAEELLPTGEGFFFGSNEYDKWYFKDIKDTIKGLTAILKEPDSKSTSYMYYSSW